MVVMWYLVMKVYWGDEWFNYELMDDLIKLVVELGDVIIVLVE